MKRSTKTRLDRLADAFTPPIPDLWVQFWRFDAPPGISAIDRCWLQSVEDQINACARELIVEHGSEIERPHPYRNDALDVLDIETMERVDHLLAAGEVTP